MTAPTTVPDAPFARLSPAGMRRSRRYLVSDGDPVEVTEGRAGIAGRLTWLAARATIHPALSIGSYVPHAPWPWGILDLAARAMLPPPGTIRATVGLPNCTAQLIRASGVRPVDGAGRVVLYLHGGAFLACGANTHGRLVTDLSRYADAPAMVVNYRLLPKHSIGQALDDCLDAYRWLRHSGYDAEQIVLAADSAGGYLSLALAERLLDDGERPAAIVAMSPLAQLDKTAKQAHPNVTTEAMFPAKVFNAFTDIIAKAAKGRVVDGRPEQVFEPLDHVEPGLPRTLIHVSGSEVMLHDARLAARTLAAAGVPVELRIWPGQAHVFQLAAPVVPEASNSLRQIGEYIREATAAPNRWTA